MRGVFRAARILSPLLLATGIIFCSHSPTEPVVADRDSITLVSIQPSLGTSLQAGAPVAFTATIAYDLASVPSGLVALVIEDQAFRNLSSTVPQPTMTVARGNGTVTLADHVVIPANGVTTVYVYFLLAASGATDSLVAQRVSYQVASSAAIGRAPGVFTGPPNPVLQRTRFARR